MIFKPIGIIHTPYAQDSTVPYQPVDMERDAQNLFFVDIEPDYTSGLDRLDSFQYIYLLYHLDRPRHPTTSYVQPPWAGGVNVGVFATRAPSRPNPIGLSIVRLFSVYGSRLFTSSIDVFDNTPVLDIKPYIRELDSKTDANYGWVEELPNRDHLLLHIKGVPHDY